MHQVVTVSELPCAQPPHFEGHCSGYTRVSMVDDRSGSIHSGLVVSQLESAGVLDIHLHSYEEAFYVLEGSVVVSIDGRAYELRAGDYGIVQVGVPHGWRNPGQTPARWLEMLSPQPRLHPKDTFFLAGAGAVPETAPRPDFRDPSLRHLGHFGDSQLPPPGQLQMDGYSGGNVTGISLKMLIDRLFGAQHLTLFMVQFQPGGAGTVHDHPFEECYFLLSGEAEAVLDGVTYRVKAGDVVWTGVGSTHGFFNKGTGPVRWIETQSPQPPDQQAFRFAADWEYLEQRLSRESRG